MKREKRRSPKAAKILIVDDHPLVRDRLKELINNESDMKVCGEAEDCRGALAAITATKPDLAVIDLTLKDSHGLDLLKDIRCQHSKLRTIIVSMHDESLYAERAMRAGANGYITKQEASRKILEAIRQVLTGELYLSQQVAALIVSKVASHPRARAGSDEELLTDRELQVYELIGRGQTTRQIAEQLRLNLSTVETYRSRIKDKFNLPDGLALTQRAVQWFASKTP